MKAERPFYNAESLKSWGDIIRPVYMNFGMGIAYFATETGGKQIPVDLLDRMVPKAIDITEQELGRRYDQDERHAIEAFFDTYIGAWQLSGPNAAHEMGCYICDMHPKKPGQRWKKQVDDKYN
jgi:hypothetical protein